MTVTVTKIISLPILTDRGIKKVFAIFKLDFSGNYVQGGDTVDLSPYLRKVDAIVPFGSPNGYIIEPDPSTFGTPSAIKVKIIQPTKSQASSLSISASIDYVKGTATTYVPDDSTLGGVALNANATIPVNVSVADAHGQVDAGPGEEYPDATAYPSGLSCYILVIGS